MTGGSEKSGAAAGLRGWMVVCAIGALLLLAPWVAMQFADQVAWGPEDFATMASMMLCAGGLYGLARRAKGSDRAFRAATLVMLATAFVLVWANLAVGIIGSENNPANRLFDGVLLVGVVGSLIARLRPKGMALALAAVAIAQVLVAVIALIAGFGATPVVTVVFTGLWLCSAWLFRKASQQEAGPPPIRRPNND